MKTSKIIISLSLIGFLSCQQKQHNSNVTLSDSNKIILSNEELKNIRIATDTLKLMNIGNTLHFKGIIDVPPQNIYSMSIPLGGYLKYTHLLPGMKIKKNEIIAVLEDPQYIQLQEDYLQTKNQYTLLEKNYLRQKELWEQKAVSDKTYEQAAAEFENCKIKLKALEEKLNIINIPAKELTADKISKTIKLSAPFSGYVTSVHFTTGKYIPPSEILFELVNPEDIHLNIKVLEKDLEYIKIGQKALAYTLSMPEKKYNCEIILINKKVNDDGTIDVHCHFEKYDESLIPGTYMQADVMVEDIKGGAIPKNAVVFYNNTYFVFVQSKANEFEMIRIEKISENENFILIRNYAELKNKKIVISNAYSLLMKLKNTEEE